MLLEKKICTVVFFWFKQLKKRETLMILIPVCLKCTAALLMVTLDRDTQWIQTDRLIS